MRLCWYRQDQDAVVDALKRGERPDLATTMSAGPLDELVALHDELGVFDALDDMPTARQRRGIDDALLLPAVAVLPFLETASFTGAAGQLFGDPAILLKLGWSPLQIRMGDNERHRNADARCIESLPCSPETLRDALGRVERQAWQLVQESGVKALFGPLLAWCKYRKNIDVLVPVPGDRDIHRDLVGLAEAGLLEFQRFSYVRVIQGHKSRPALEGGARAGLTSWDSFLKAAKEYGACEPSLWGCLLRPVDPAKPDDKPWTLVSTRAGPTAEAGFQAYRPRWHIENDAYRELKEGWRLERELWGRNAAVQLGARDAYLPGLQHRPGLPEPARRSPRRCVASAASVAITIRCWGPRPS